MGKDQLKDAMLLVGLTFGSPRFNIEVGGSYGEKLHFALLKLARTPLSGPEQAMYLYDFIRLTEGIEKATEPPTGSSILQVKSASDLETLHATRIASLANHIKDELGIDMFISLPNTPLSEMTHVNRNDVMRLTLGPSGFKVLVAAKKEGENPKVLETAGRIISGMFLDARLNPVTLEQQVTDMQITREDQGKWDDINLGEVSGKIGTHPDTGFPLLKFKAGYDGNQTVNWYLNEVNKIIGEKINGDIIIRRGRRSRKTSLHTSGSEITEGEDITLIAEPKDAKGKSPNPDYMKKAVIVLGAILA
ncbi:MAG: hypothetical protein ABH950_02240, partial [Candidatus Altiarchaeota archaeon]